VGGVSDLGKPSAGEDFFRQARRFSAEILSDFQGRQRRLAVKGPSGDGSAGSDVPQRCVQKGNRPCAQRHKDGKQSYDLPPSAGFTIEITCCLWNASGIISNKANPCQQQFSTLFNIKEKLN